MRFIKSHYIFNQTNDKSEMKTKAKILFRKEILKNDSSLPILLCRVSDPIDWRKEKK
jgi:hypothetical protein